MHQAKHASRAEHQVDAAADVPWCSKELKAGDGSSVTVVSSSLVSCNSTAIYLQPRQQLLAHASGLSLLLLGALLMDVRPLLAGMRAWKPVGAYR